MYTLEHLHSWERSDTRVTSLAEAFNMFSQLRPCYFFTVSPRIHVFIGLDYLKTSKKKMRVNSPNFRYLNTTYAMYVAHV